MGASPVQIKRVALNGLILLALLLPGLALAETVSLAVDTVHLNLGPHMEYLEDREGSLSIESVTQTEQPHQWTLSNRETPTFGYTSSTYWLRFSLTTETQASRDYLLEVAYPVLDHLEVFIFRDDQQIQYYRMGDRYPFSQRPIDHPNFVIPLEVSPESITQVYLRVQTGSSLQVPAHLWHDHALLEHRDNVVMGQALFYGAMLVMAIYNFLIFIAIRDISYFYYVMYVLSTTLLLAGIQGITFKYLWPNTLWLNDTSLVLALSGMIFFPTLFFRSFLQIPQTRPILAKILLGFAALAILTAIGAFLLPYRIMMVTTMIIVMLAILMGFWVGIVRWLDGYHAAKYFNLAWASMLAAGLILAFNKLGLLPRTWFTEHVAQIGATLEVILLSFALAHRISHERQMREQAQRESALAQQKLLEHQIRANEDLDRIVRQRTEELEKANAKLKQISATDGLTGLKNRRAFEELFELEYKRAYREKTPIAVIMVDLDHFKKINDQYGHPFGDKCLVKAAEMIRTNIRRPPDVAARYGGEEFILLLPNTDLEGTLCVAHNILETFMRTEVQDGDISLTMTASLGVACHVPDDQTSREALLREADQYLYQAKENGRNRVEWKQD